MIKSTVSLLQSLINYLWLVGSVIGDILQVKYRNKNGLELNTIKPPTYIGLSYDNRTLNHEPTTYLVSTYTTEVDYEKKEDVNLRKSRTVKGSKKGQKLSTPRLSSHKSSRSIVP